MNSRTPLILLCSLLIIIGIASADTTMTEDFTASAVWICPDNVYTISTLDMIGGGSGGSGGWVDWVSPVIAGGGVGGRTAIAVRQTNISVTPGSSYEIVIGVQGEGDEGFKAISTTPAKAYNGTSGQNTTAFGYTAEGAKGWLNNVTWDGLGNITVHGDSTGQSSTIGSYKVADDGVSAYSDGASAGYGFGAGGGGGGNGTATYPGYAGGAGGDGASGYARIIYTAITNATTDTYKVKYPPSDIRFHVQEIAGASITGVFVTAAPYQTTLGNYGYVAELFGYDVDTIPLNLLQLNGTTDSRGDITFAMMSDVSYKMTFTKGGYTFDDLVITPHDDNYFIYPVSTGSVFVRNGTTPAANVAYNMTWQRINSTYGSITVSYIDIANATTWGNITIYRPEVKT